MPGKTIKVDGEVYQKLAELKAELWVERGRRTTFNDAVKYLLEKI